MEVRELRSGVWRWTARHPDWTPADTAWGPDVGSYALTGEGLVLVDPLVPADDAERFWAALDRDAAAHGPPRVVLTVPWHRRSTEAVLDRYDGAELWLYEHRETSDLQPTHTFGTRDELPGGLRAFDSGWYGEVELWAPRERAVVTGDVLLGEGGGVRMCPDSWLGDVSRAAVLEALRPLLELPVEAVLPTHGEPVVEGAADALARALAR